MRWGAFGKERNEGKVLGESWIEKGVEGLGGGRWDRQDLSRAGDFNVFKTMEGWGFGDKLLLSSPSWPGTHDINQAGFELALIHLPLSLDCWD